MRSSDINKLRRLRFAQAVLLGVEFKTEPLAYGRKRWMYRLPDGDGLWHLWKGYYLTRGEVVLEALRELQVELKEGDYRGGNNPSCGGAVDVLPDAAKV